MADLRVAVTVIIAMHLKAAGGRRGGVVAVGVGTPRASSEAPPKSPSGHGAAPYPKRRARQSPLNVFKGHRNEDARQCTEAHRSTVRGVPWRGGALCLTGAARDGYQPNELK